MANKEMMGRFSREAMGLGLVVLTMTLSVAARAQDDGSTEIVPGMEDACIENFGYMGCANGLPKPPERAADDRCSLYRGGDIADGDDSWSVPRAKLSKQRGAGGFAGLSQKWSLQLPSADVGGEQLRWIGRKLCGQGLRVLCGR